MSTLGLPTVGTVGKSTLLWGEGGDFGKRLSVVLLLGTGKRSQHSLFGSRDVTDVNYCPQVLGINNAHHAPETLAVCKDASAIKQEIAACQGVNQVTNDHNPAQILPSLKLKTKHKPEQLKSSQEL